jgi:O-methyltransferase
MNFDEIKNMVREETLLPDANLETLFESCEAVRSLDGVAVEVGVYKGGSLKMIAKCLPDKLVFGFDTFEGIQVIVSEDNGIEHAIGEFAQDIEKVQKFIIDLPNITLVKGIFPKTFMALGRKNKVCLAHIDADSYFPTFSALNLFWGRLVVGGIMLVHDFNWGSTPGVTKAVNDFVNRFSAHDTSISHGEIKKENCISYYRIIKNS